MILVLGSMMIMLRITAVSAGAVDYLLRGSGCAEHDHPQQRTAEQAAEQSLEAGPERTPAQDAPGYFVSATQHGEAPGVWMGNGLDAVDMQSGALATEDDVRAVFGELKHPDTGEYLGRAPRKFRNYQERLSAALEAEPEATPERRRDIETAVQGDSRKAVAYYDFTFSPVKSVSVYYTALLSAGATEDAAKVLDAHRDAVTVAMDYAERHASYTRTGYHGKTRDGRSVGRYEATEGLAMTRWDHSTNREKEPQLHSHVAVLNRSRTVSDQEIRALDGKGFRAIKEAIATAYERALEHKLGEVLGVRFALRPDGKAREILGVDPQLCQQASTRRQQVEERVDELVEAYVDKHGREPSPAARKALAQAATLETRAAKGPGEAGPAALLQWAESRVTELGDTLDAVQDAAADVAVNGHPDREILPDQHNRDAILQAAVDAVQEQYPTWTIGNLIAAIDAQFVDLPVSAEDRPQVLEDMAREVLQPGNDHGVLLITAPDPVEVPAPLRRPEDGRNIFRPHIDERYTTQQHLDTEQRIVIGARQQTAPCLQGPELELLRVELEGAGLGVDQVDAVVGIMASGRAGDVLIGPAGAGKSFTVGALAQTWQENFGGRVLGLATSQRATDVLSDDGLEAINTTQFLMRFSPGADGQARDQVQPGDLFVVDEAGMSSTTELARIAAIVEAGGGKLLYTGDYEQLSAVQAGGMLHLLATDNGAFELAEVHRFEQAWEADASLRLREGDVAVVREYEDHGRLRGGTVDEMQAAAVRGYLADTVSGLESLLVVGSNADASELARGIRRELVRLGRVSPDVLGELRDGNVIGAGDVIQARRNDSSVQVDGPGMVTNRATYTVIGRNADGGLRVRRGDGTLAHLPESYVREHVALAYASTVHAAQGRTVDTTHDLLDEHSHRQDAYTALTRGRLRNTAYLISERVPDEHEPERVDSVPAAVLTTILSNDGADQAAEIQRRIGVEEGQSLAWIGIQWDEISREYARDRYTDVLADLLPPHELDQVVDEPGYARLIRAVREAELSGHNAESVLRHAVEQRELHTADSCSDVLRHRIRISVDDRAPEQHVDAGDWTTLAAPLEGTVGQYLQELAVLATDRMADLGERAAIDQPEWAVAHLGPPPEDPEQRQEWVHRAGIAAGYRELRNVPNESISLGAAPSREQEWHRTLWQHAHAALGHPADALDYHSATEAELREMRARWQREQTWAPPYVAEELQAAYTVADGCRQDAALYAAHVDTLRVDAPERAAAIADADRAGRLADEFAERARQLEELHEARARWFDATDQARLQDQLATDELERRGLIPRPGSAPQPEQLPLFGIPDDLKVDATAGRDQYEPEQVASTGGDHEPVRRTPALDAEPGEPVQWWQQWLDRIVGRGTDQAADVEQHQDAELDARAHSSDHQVERERVDDDQLSLFEATPTVEDVVQAQPLRETDSPQDDELRATLAEARRAARAAGLLRQQRDAADAVRAEHRAHTARQQQTEADRARRDQAELDAAREPVREAAATTERAREPSIEMVQTPTDPG